MRAIIPSKFAHLALAAMGAATVAGGVWTLQATAPRAYAPREILANRPLFGQAWLELAAEEFRDTGRLSDAGRAALARSIELSPYEGKLLIERSLLGIPAWPHLTDALKDGVARDLANAFNFLSGPLQVRLMVTGMSDADRQELRKKLVARQVPEGRLTPVGF